MRAAFLLVLMAVSAALGPATAGTADTSIVGYWYGRGYQPTLGHDNEFIENHAADGSFEIHFRTYKGCTVIEEQFEAGTWTMLDADTVRVTTTAINGSPAGPYVDDYRTEELTEQSYRCVWVQKGIAYTAQRVDADFKFPECGLTS